MLKSQSRYIDYLIIAIVVIIGYWQVSLYQYTIKCDAALLSLPWKKFVSDSLRNGYFPIWNPYINLGWTQGMEPSSWYYPSWIFALFGKYRLSYLHTEITLHLILGAIGMYKLLSRLKLDRWALISGSAVYIFSGFFIGNFQHLGWTFYGCWLPVVLYFFFELLNKPNWSTAFKFGFTGAMLVLSSYIPFIVTTLIFMNITLVLVVIKNLRNKNIGNIIRILKFLGLSIFVLFLICSPCFYMLFVNIDIMYRGGRYDDRTAGFGSLVPMSWISLIAPFGTVAKDKMWSTTDISMNNIFIGVISLILIVFSFTEKEKRKLIFLVSGIGLLALLFAFGSYFSPTWFIFRHLPFYEKLRFASQFRIYFIVSASILVAIGSNYLLKNNRSKRIQVILIAACLVCMIFGISGNFEIFLKHFNAVFVREKNEYSVIQSVKFQTLIWGILFLILTIWHLVTRKNKFGIAKKLIVFNILFLVVAVQMNMFYTGVANEKVSKINKEWIKLPTQFHPIQNKTYADYWHAGVGLTWTNTGTLYQVPNINCYHPYNSKNYGDYLNIKTLYPQDSPIIHSKKDFEDEKGNSYYSLWRQTDFIDLNPYGMKFTVELNNADTVLVQMSPTPATKIRINEKPVELKTINSMMAIFNVPQGSGVVISFLPKYAILFGWVGMVGFIGIILTLLILRIRKNNHPLT